MNGVQRVADDNVRNIRSYLTAADKLDRVVATGSGPVTVIMSDGVAEVPTSGPLAAALQARSPGEYNAQLHVLRCEAKLSLANVAKREGGLWLSKSTVQRMTRTDKLATNAEQINGFVIACGATKAETALWIKAWRDLRDGRTPEPAGQGRTGPRILDLSFPTSAGEPVITELRFKVTPSTHTVLAAGVTGFAATTQGTVSVVNLMQVLAKRSMLLAILAFVPLCFLCALLGLASGVVMHGFLVRLGAMLDKRLDVSAVVAAQRRADRSSPGTRT